MARPVTNHELDALLTEAGYSDAQAAFARQVNLQGRQTRQLNLKYDGASVYWWLRGRSPEYPVPILAAEVLTRRLGRTIKADDLGFRTESTETTRLGLTYATSLDDTRVTVGELWRHLVLRRELLSVAPFVVAATMEAGWRWHFDPRDPDTSHGGHRQVNAGDIAALRACQQQFVDLDRRHGGGHSRALLAGWLHREVAPLLHGTYTDQVGRQLLAAIAELTGQVAFMSYDIGDHGAAQRYFIQALRLAKAGDDPAFGAHILANMATQAVFLQQPQEAVRLARAAVEGGRRRAHASVMARLYTAEACAHAIANDPRSCSAALANAERAMGRTDADGPAWATYFTPAHFAGTAVRCWRDLGQPRKALRHATEALTLDDHSNRTRVLHTALVASVHVAGAGRRSAAPTQFDLEQACALGEEALSLAEAVRSRRVSDRLAELACGLAPHRRLAPVAAFLDRAERFARAA